MIAQKECIQCRVVVIGDASVGKTSILNQLVEHKFNQYEPSTVGANYQLFVKEADGIKIEVQIWDTAGQEKFRSLGPIYFRNAVGALAVFSLNNRNSFHNLDDWINTFTEVAGTEATIAIAANKSDLINEYEISIKEAQDWANERGYIFEATSAKTSDGVEALFDKLALQLIQNTTSNIKQNSKNLSESSSKQSSCC